MKGFLYKDLISMQHVLKTYIVVFVAMLVLGIFLPSTGSFTSVFFIVMMLMQQLNNFTYDDTAKWDRYAAAMPVKRSSVVTARYLASLIVLATILPVSFVAGLSNIFRGEEGALASLLGSILVAVCIYLFMVGVGFAACCKFGAEKGRYVMIGAFLALFAIVMLFLRGIYLQAVSERSLYLVFLTSLLACVLAFILSLLFSKRIYSKKEF
jgi:hypothetical protein